MMIMHSYPCMSCGLPIIENKKKIIFGKNQNVSKKKQPPEVIKIRLPSNRTIHMLNRFCFF